MTDDELQDALDGLHAYDTGCVDSGIHDEALRARVKVELVADAEAQGPHTVVGPRLNRAVRELYLSDTALEQGYGLEDVHEFIKWLDDRMDFSL